MNRINLQRVGSKADLRACKSVVLLEQGEKTAVQQGAQEDEDELRQD